VTAWVRGRTGGQGQDPRRLALARVRMTSAFRAKSPRSRPDQAVGGGLSVRGAPWLRGLPCLSSGSPFDGAPSTRSVLGRPFGFTGPRRRDHHQHEQGSEHNPHPRVSHRAITPSQHSSGRRRRFCTSYGRRRNSMCVIRRFAPVRPRRHVPADADGHTPHGEDHHQLFERSRGHQVGIRLKTDDHSPMR